MNMITYSVERFPLLLFMVYFSLILATGAIPLQSPSVLLSKLKSWGLLTEERESDESSVQPSIDDEYMGVPLQLKSLKCPSRAGEELLDYWRCLWRTSLTAEGMEQERRELIETYISSAAVKPSTYSSKQSKHRMKRDLEGVQDNPNHFRERTVPRYNPFSEYPGLALFLKDHDMTPGEAFPFANDSNKKSFRHKRAATMEQIQQIFEEGNTDFAWMLAWNHDLLGNLDKFMELRNCQHTFVKPGVNVKNFIGCIKDASEEGEAYTKHEIFSAYRERDNPSSTDVNVTYDSREFKIDKVKVGGAKTLDLLFSFDRLTNEDTHTDFKGADPYLKDQLSGYRYRYNNLDFEQKQPAFSYSGKDGARGWHNLDLKKFFIPLDSSVTDLKNIITIAEFVEAYPGVGDVIFELGLQSPFNKEWNKDVGYHAYTRFLIPTIQESDLPYLKYKKSLPITFKRRSDSDGFKFVAGKMRDFLNKTAEPLDPTNFTDPDDIPFISAYKSFIKSSYQVELHNIVTGFERYNDTVQPVEEYDVIRKTLRYYLFVVASYMECLRAVTEENEARQESTELTELLASVVKSQKCPVGSVNNTDFENGYLISDKSPFTEFQELYSGYFDRKEARVSYSLPVFPYEFPVCRQNEPSPIDILTHKGRKSSLRDYLLGDAGYRIEPFFMMYPNDGSNLLTIGIVNGERLDYSSVQLSGGAVKGENLTFQYMFLRFSHSWDVVGSEHRINGVGAQMEVQMLFTISGSADDLKYYHILARIQNQLFQSREKLVIILSRLVEVLPTDEDVRNKIEELGTKQDPHVFEPFAQAAYSFRKQWEKTPNKPVPRGYVSRQATFRLIDFIPGSKSEFYTYRGSLTWPPCFSYVLWSVYEQRMYISKRQFDQFTKIPAFGVSSNNLASDNFRDPNDVYVEAENLPDVEYATRQHLIQQRTVERFVLIGVHDPESANNDEAGIVDAETYYYSDVAGDLNQATKIVSKWPLECLVVLSCLLYIYF